MKPKTPNVKLIAAVVHELVATDVFDDWVSLSEAIKARCAMLQIAYDSGSITDAVRLVERSRPVLRTQQPARTNPHHVERVDDARPLSRTEATDLYRRLSVAHAREHAKRGAA